MKRQLVLLSILLIALGFPSAVTAAPSPQNPTDIEQEIGNILKKKSLSNNQKIPAAPFQAVTTGIRDAYPIASWLDRYSQFVKPQDTNTLTLAPGYYRVTVRSYCLHAGSYAPTQGVGYLLSPLKGTARGLITDILKQSEQHPEVAQQDVQQLIWGIEAGVKFGQYPPAFKARVAALLTPQNIVAMEFDNFLGSLRLNLPKELVDIAGFFDQFRGMLTNPNMSYAQLEQFAVRTGTPPIGSGSLSYASGPWAYAQQQGFYVREVDHHGYQSTVLEILRPGAHVIERDAQGRIARVRTGTASVEIFYQDENVSQQVPAVGFPAARTSRLRGIRVTGARANGNGALALTTSPGFSAGATSTVSWMSSLPQIAQYEQAIKHPGGQNTQTAQDLADLTGLLESFSSATPLHANSIQAPGFRTVSFSTSPTQQASSVNAPVLSQAQEAVVNAWAYAGCVHLGQCVPGPQTNLSIITQPERLELAGHVQSPANTSMQRLSLQSTASGSSGQLIVKSATLEIPTVSRTISLPSRTGSHYQPPSHTINPTNPNPTCPPMITFSNQDTAGDCTTNCALPTEGFPFTLRITVVNQSQYALPTPSLKLTQTSPLKDAAGNQPGWNAFPLNPPAEIPPGQYTLNYTVSATWTTFTQPAALDQFLSQLLSGGVGESGDILDLLDDLGQVASAEVGAITTVYSVSSDLQNLLKTNFILSVDYQIAILEQGIPLDRVDVVVMAQPQEIGVLPEFIGQKFSQLATDTVPKPFVGPVVDPLIAEWANQAIICQQFGPHSNACVIASAPVTDTWYGSVLSGQDIVPQPIGCQTTMLRPRPTRTTKAASTIATKVAGACSLATLRKSVNYGLPREGLVYVRAPSSTGLSVGRRSLSAAAVRKSTLVSGKAGDEPTQSSTTTIQASRPWTDSGILLKIGDSVSITASGAIEVAEGGGVAAQTPAGTGMSCTAAPITSHGFVVPQLRFIMPSLPCWSLIGRIGPSGKMFEIGATTTFQVLTAGRLYLGVNADNFSDNSGTWIANISVSRAGLSRPTEYSGLRISMSANPNTVGAGSQAMIFGVVHDASGKPIAGAPVQLTAMAGGTTTAPSTLTTDANGAFSAPFTAPPTPGVVTFRVTVSGSAPPIVATATLSVKPTADKPSIATPQEDPNSPQKRAPSAIARKSGIRSVDFQNFDYSSNCLEENGPLQIIHITQGRANNDDGDFLADKPVFGDLKGDGQEEAVVVLSCHPADMSPNVVSSKIFIFEMSASGPNVLAKLPASNWGDRRVESTKVANKNLEVSYTDGECNACKDWIVTVRFHWNGSQFVRTGQTRKPYKTSSSIWKRADRLSWVSFTAASGRRAEN